MRIPRPRVSRRLRVPAILALLITLLAGLAAQAGTASAATAAATPARGAAAKPAAPRSVTKPAVKPRSAAARAAAGSPSERRATAAAAIRRVIAASAASTCSGPISPDTFYSCTAPSSTGTDTFTLTLPDATDVLLVRVLSTSGESLPITITAPDSTTVTCQQPTQLFQCTTSQAGTYTLAVTNDSTDYAFEYTALLSESTCPAIDTSFTNSATASPVTGSLVAGQTGACYSLPTSMSSGDVLLANSTATTDPLTVAVFDSTGTQICVDDNGTCTLTGTGPYRVFVSAQYGNADSYDMFLNDITNPAGCVAAPQLVYGQVPPSASSADMCRTLTVAKSDNYRIYSVGSGNPVLQGTIYTASGTSACNIPTGISPYCQLTPGDYSFVANELPNASLIPYGLSFVAGDESQGCTATNDTGFANGPATGQFTGIGEELCLNLPTASGGTDYFFDQPAADGTVATVVGVVDATGAPQCFSSNGDFTYAICTLSGTAPFRVILSAGTPKADYQLLVNRSGSTAGCAAWPASGFGGSYGATVTLTYADDVKCLVIPAGQHSTGEMIDYSNTANVVDGAINVLDPSGTQVCLGNSTAICSYKSGVTYTALVSTTAAHGDTYHLVRRDVSSTATCARPASTAVGGPSTTFTLNSDLDTLCWRVTAAATDKLIFNVRAIAPTPAGAVLQVTNSSGAVICREFGQAFCRVTGSSDYQLLVTASGYSGVAIATHLDTWLVGTASGWVPQCQAHHFSAADNWGPVTGTLTEKAAGYCAVVDLEALQQFKIAGTDTSGYPDNADVNIYTPTDWTTEYINGVCGTSNYGEFGASCGTNQETNLPAEGVLLLDPGTAPNPVGYTMQGICQSTCAEPRQTPTITAVTPSKQPAGPVHTIVVTGTNLNLGTSFELASNGSPATSYQIAFPQSVNAAGTKLTLLLNTTGITPGTYDVVLDQVGYTTGTPSPGYLPGGYTVTAAPPVPSPSRFVPVTPKRILDTQHGIGARKARVARGGTVNLTVAGTAGVPAKGVAAVAVELTAVNPAAAGHLVAYPYGTARPGVTDLSFAGHQTATNLVVVPVRDGKISLCNASPGAVDLTADVVGYYAAGSKGYALTAVSPARILDTRSGTGARKARVAARGTVVLQVVGKGGVPASGVAAVALDVTAVRPAAAGQLVVYPAGTARAGVSDLSFAAGQTVTSLVVVPVRGGKVSLYNASTGPLDLTADVTGYYSASGPLFSSLGPVRMLDTRTGLGGAGGMILPHAAAVTPPIVNMPGIPPTVTSVVLDVTVTDAQHSGALTVLPDGGSLPAVQNLVYSGGQTVSGLVIVVPVVDGAIDFYNDSPGTVQVVADLEGYYAT
jgi:hypothetical protein